MNKINKMDVILAIVGTFLAAFTVAMVLVYIFTGGVPDTLVTCVYSGCGLECFVMGWIKTNNEKHHAKKDENANCAVGVLDSTTGESDETETIVE